MCNIDKRKDFLIFCPLEVGTLSSVKASTRPSVIESLEVVVDGNADKSNFVVQGTDP